MPPPESLDLDQKVWLNKRQEETCLPGPLEDALGTAGIPAGARGAGHGARGVQANACTRAGRGPRWGPEKGQGHVLLRGPWHLGELSSLGRELGSSALEGPDMEISVASLIASAPSAGDLHFSEGGDHHGEMGCLPGAWERLITFCKVFWPWR